MSSRDQKQPDAFDRRCTASPARRPAIVKFSPLPPHVPLFVSDNIVDHLGYAPGDVIGNPNFLVDSVHPDDRDQFISSLFHLFGRGFHLYDYRLLKKDRTITRMVVETRLHRDPAGAPLSITGTYAEPSVLAGLVGAGGFGPSSLPSARTPAIELIIDSAGRIRKVSSEVRDLLGYAPQKLIGTGILQLVPSDYHILLRQALSRMLDSCMDTLFFWTAVRHRNGGVRFLANECHGFNDARGERYFKACCHDITDHVRAAQELFSAYRDTDELAPEAASDPFRALTAREREVLALVVEGRSSTQIGVQLAISPRTVETHRSNLMKKLGVTSASQLIRYACCSTKLPPTT